MKGREQPMILINKEEKEAIIKEFPRAYITRIAKQKTKRHRYYCEETREILKFLNHLRTEM